MHTPGPGAHSLLWGLLRPGATGRDRGLPRLERSICCYEAWVLLQDLCLE